MKRQFLSAWFLAVASMLLIVPCTSADILVSHGGGSWQSTWTVNEDGNPFWDHTSADGSQKNIGYYVSGTGAFTTQYLPYSGPGFSSAIPGTRYGRRPGLLLSEKQQREHRRPETGDCRERGLQPVRLV